jgi:hypothetical protein
MRRLRNRLHCCRCFHIGSEESGVSGFKTGGVGSFKVSHMQPSVVLGRFPVDVDLVKVNLDDIPLLRLTLLMFGVFLSPICPQLLQCCHLASGCPPARQSQGLLLIWHC